MTVIFAIPALGADLPTLPELLQRPHGRRRPRHRADLARSCHRNEGDRAQVPGKPGRVHLLPGPGSDRPAIPALEALEASARIPAWNAWLGLAVAILFFWPVATLHVRFSSFAEVLFIIVLAEFIDRSAARPRRRTATCLSYVRSRRARPSAWSWWARSVSAACLMNAGEAEGRTQSAQTRRGSLQHAGDRPLSGNRRDSWPADEAPHHSRPSSTSGPNCSTARVIMSWPRPITATATASRDSHKMMTLRRSGDGKIHDGRERRRAWSYCARTPRSGCSYMGSGEGCRQPLCSSCGTAPRQPWLAPVDLPENLSGEFKLYEKRF